jgi:hypothetical protein
MHYYHQLNHAQRRKFIRRVGLFFILIVIILGVGAGLAYVDSIRTKGSNTEAATTTETTTSYFEPNVQVFRTGYFQFQANSSWAQIIPESTDNKFVYRSKRGSLIERELVIYVNQIPDNLAVTHILPVDIKADGSLSAGTFSDHCGKTLPAGQRSTRVLVEQQVSFLCWVDNTKYDALVGQINGTTKLSLPRPGGSLATYAIYYSDVTATPSSVGLEDIVQTFQTR